jgi:thiamine-phosphate pyrophosphorylase
MTIHRSEPPLRGLYAITPESRQPRRPLAFMVEQAILGGARLVQYRDKGTDTQRRLDEATAMVALCRHHRVPLIINDDVELAAAVGADGVHLGKDDMAPEQARRRIGAAALIGVSCYDRLENAERAAGSGADYLAFGRFFPSASKPQAVAADPQLLRLARTRFALPLVAIGGISPQNGGPLINAGADLLAAIEAVFGSSDIRAASRAFAQLFEAPDNRLTAHHPS